MYQYFPSFLNADMAQANEVIPCGCQGRIYPACVVNNMAVDGQPTDGFLSLWSEASFAFYLSYCVQHIPPKYITIL